mgnify:CR=1 FL=1
MERYAQPVPAEAREHPAADPLERCPCGSAEDGYSQAVERRCEHAIAPRCRCGVRLNRCKIRSSDRCDHGRPGSKIHRQVQAYGNPSDARYLSDPPEIDQKKCAPSDPSTHRCSRRPSPARARHHKPQRHHHRHQGEPNQPTHVPTRVGERKRASAKGADHQWSPALTGPTEHRAQNTRDPVPLFSARLRLRCGWRISHSVGLQCQPEPSPTDYPVPCQPAPSRRPTAQH